MKICGASIKLNTIFLIVLEKDMNGIKILNPDVEFALVEPDDYRSVKLFRDTLQNFFDNNEIKVLVIKKRLDKGDYAASGVTFKVEGIAQSLELGNIVIIDNKDITSLKKFFVTPNNLGVNQKKAYEAGCAYILKDEKFENLTP